MTPTLQGYLFLFALGFAVGAGCVIKNMKPEVQVQTITVPAPASACVEAKPKYSNKELMAIPECRACWNTLRDAGAPPPRGGILPPLKETP